MKPPASPAPATCRPPPRPSRPRWRHGGAPRPSRDRARTPQLRRRCDVEAARIAEAACGPLPDEAPRRRPRRPTRGRPSSPGSFANAAGRRDYKLYVPPKRGDATLPLVVMLHGCTQNPDDFAAGTAMNELAHAAGLLRAVPGAVAARPIRRRCWNWFKHSHQQRGRGEPALLAGMTRAGDGAARDRPAARLRRRPVGRRRDGGDPGRGVPRPVCRRRRALGPAGRCRHRPAVGAGGHEQRAGSARARSRWTACRPSSSMATPMPPCTRATASRSPRPAPAPVGRRRRRARARSGQCPRLHPPRPTARPAGRWWPSTGWCTARRMRGRAAARGARTPTPGVPTQVRRCCASFSSTRASRCSKTQRFRVIHVSA